MASCLKKYDAKNDYARINMLLGLPNGEALVTSILVEEDAQKIIEAYNKGIFTADFSFDVVRPESEVDEDFETDINLAGESNAFSPESKYYRLYGHTSNDQSHYESLMKGFRTRIMSSIIFDLASRTPIFAQDEMDNGHSKLNTEIALYKVELIKKLASKINYKFKYINLANVSEEDLSELEQDELVTSELLMLFFEYESRSKNEQDSESRDLYFLLHEFDRLLTSEFSWIKTDTSTERFAFVLDRFEIFDPKVKHRRSYSTDDEMESAIAKFTSDYMSKLLDYIPEVREGDNTDIPYSHIGFKEFCNAISTVYDWALNSDDVDLEIFNEARKGNRGNVGMVIQSYLNRKNWSRGYNTSHLNKLRGLLKYIYHPDTFVETKNLFVNQIEKTVKTDWLCYESEWDPEAKSYKIIHKKLSAMLIDKHTQSIYKAIKSNVYRYRETPDQFAKDFGVGTAENPNSIQIFFVDSDTIGIKGLSSDNSDAILYFSYTTSEINNKKVVKWNESSSLENIDSKKVVELVRKLLQINIDSDRESEVLNNIGERNILDVFIPVIMHTILAIHDSKTVSIGGKEVKIKSNYNFEKTDNWSLDLSMMKQQFIPASEYLNGVYSSEQYVTLKDLHGNSLPYFQLGSYMHDLKKIAYDLKHEDRCPYKSNVMLRSGVIGTTLLRSDTDNQGKLSKSKKLSSSDITYLSVFKDMWAHLLNGETDENNRAKAILVQPTCNADKSKFDLRQVNLANILIEDGDEVRTAHDLLYKIASELSTQRGPYGTKYTNSTRQHYVDLVENEISNYRRDKTKSLLLDTIRRVTSILSMPVNISNKMSYSELMNVVSKIHEKLNEYSELDLEQIANEKGIDFFPESDIVKGPFGWQLNETLLSNARMYWDDGVSEAFKKRIKRNKFSFIKNLRKDRFFINYRSDASLKFIVDTTFKNAEDRKVWVDEISGNIRTHRIFKDGKEYFPKEYELSEVYDNPQDYEIELNPILEAYYYSQNWFAQSITDVLYSDVSNFASKAKGDMITDNMIVQILKEEFGTYPADWKTSTNSNVRQMVVFATNEAFSRLGEASRLSTQFKRNMIGGSTRHNLMPQQFGTSDEIIVACFEDMKGPVYNLLGATGSENVQDGAGFSSPVETVLENWSYLDAALGKSRKTIWGYHNPRTGHFQEIKWACFTLTNEVRRNSIVNEDCSAEKMFYGMHALTFNDDKIKDIDLSKFWNQNEIYYSEQSDWTHRKITMSNDLYRYDYKTGKRYVLESVSKDPSTNIHTTTWREVSIDSDGNITRLNNIDYLRRTIKTFYDIDQLFGGAFIEEYDLESKSFVETDANAIIMAHVACEHNLKNKFVGFALPHQTIKTSVQNRNKWSSLQSNKPLVTFPIKLTYGGAQLNAEHEVEDGDVAEMMQTVAALAQNGYLIDTAYEVYELIGGVIRESIPNIRKAMELEDDSKLNRILGKILIDSFNKEGSHDRLGLAEAFVRNAERELSLNSKADIKIPFSDNSIKGKFMAQVASNVNKAIKRRYPGLGTVQAPSYKLMSYYNFGGQNVSFIKLTELLHNPIETIVDDKTIVEESYVSRVSKLVPNLKDPIKYRNYRSAVDNLLHNQMIDVNGNISNPLIDRCDVKKVKALQIEDTVIIRTTGNQNEGKVFQIKDIRTLDYVKNLLDLNEFEVYIWKGQPKELRAASTTLSLISNLEIGLYAESIDLYELDVTRAMFYINEMLNNKEETHAAKLDTIIRGSELPILWANDKQKMLNLIKKVINTNESLNEYKNANLNDETVLKQLAKDLRPILQEINAGLSEQYRNNIPYELDVQDSMLSGILNESSFITLVNAINYGYNPSDEEILKLSSYIKSMGISVPDVIFNPTVVPLIEVANSYKVGINKVHTEPPQIILGRAYAKLLGIGPNDNVWDITGPEYFEKRIREVERMPLESEIPSDMYDCMLMTETGKKVLVMIGSTIEKDHLINQPKVHVGGKDVYSKFGSLFIDGEEIDIAHDVYTYINDNEESFEIVRINSIDDLDTLYSSGVFSQIRYNYKQDNYQKIIDRLIEEGETSIINYEHNGKRIVEKEISLDNLLTLHSEDAIQMLKESDFIKSKKYRTQLANKRWKAFQETLNFIGARIPTQSQQSFSSAKILMFANIDTNECWLPRVVTWLEGSDYKSIL